MGAEGTVLGLEAERQESAVELLMHLPKRRQTVRETDPQHTRRALWRKDAALTEGHVEWLELNLGSKCVEHRTNAIVAHVTDEANRQVKVRCRNPLRAHRSVQRGAQGVDGVLRLIEHRLLEFDRDE